MRRVHIYQVGVELLVECLLPQLPGHDDGDLIAIIMGDCFSKIADTLLVVL